MYIKQGWFRKVLYNIRHKKSIILNRTFFLLINVIKILFLGVIIINPSEIINLSGIEDKKRKKNY